MTIVAAVLMFYVSMTPIHTARADETAAQKASVGAEDVSGATETVKCPNCGETFTIGRHGQEAVTATCPKCGKELSSDACKMDECKTFSYGADAGFFSKYVARGVVTTNGAVFQPDVWANWKGATFSVWGNMDLTDVNKLGGEFNELDINLAYSGNIGKVCYSAGGIYYTYPNTTFKDTAEVYGSLGLETLLKPKLTLYYDFVEANGVYVLFSVGHSVELLKKGNLGAELELSAQAGFGSAGFNRLYFDTGHGSITDMVFTVSLPVECRESLTVKPSLAWSTVPYRKIRAKQANNDNVIAGLTLSAAF